MIKYTRKSFGLTITEILIAIVILGIVIAFAVPNYQKAIERAHQVNTQKQLTLIHSAQKIFYTKNNSYWPLGSTTNANLQQLNDDLGLHIIANGMNYACTTTSGGDEYQCSASRQPPASAFTITVEEAPLSETNPICTGTCPS